ncbi:trypsin-like peptidase domain-containing protein [Microbacterium esteraromaticum]|uniref:trypsin-like peptidase domain-containing protein n=1 Tax=Microbacterium esteraromaticum TaxID=57043 RepID=UPI001A8E64CE|nr:trypsin-like peptidase domain-containing protein [Microbacterium esteraromaticum]MBN8425003.1 trypsin-like peptidase domain-containing protein [Microbacterium esteraromaticum]
MPRPPVSTIADQVFYSTVRIETSLPNGTSTGTGFLLLYSSDEVVYPVLVTNKHVLADATAATFTLARSENGAPMSAGTQITMTEFSPAAWLGHPRVDVDVAVMAFGPVLNEMENRGAPAFYRAFGNDLLLTEAQAESLDSIENVTFVGYPSGLFDTASMLPIARRGQTATPIFNDYRGWPAFLIDASVFPGSSGSPVLILDRGSYTTRGGDTHIASRLYVAGVVAAVHTRRVHGEVQMAATGVASFDDAIDLGIVFKASTIQECVDLLFQRLGVDLTGAPDASALA